MQHEILDRRIGNWAALGWALLGALVCWSMAGLEPNLVEEGTVVHVAQRIAHGDRLYRDIVFFSGPLPFQLLALLFRVFGEELVVGRMAAVGLYGVAIAFAYAFLRRAGVGPLAHAAAATLAAMPILLFPLLSIFWYTNLALYLSLIVLYVALRATHSPRWAFAAGVLVSGVALCKQSIGVILAAALLAALSLSTSQERRPRLLGSMVAGGASVAALTLGLFALNGTLSDALRCLITIPLSIEAGYSSPFINLWPLGSLSPEIAPNKVLYLPNYFYLAYGILSSPGPRVILVTQILYALPLAVLLATLLRRLIAPLPAAAWIGAAVLLAMSSNLFPRTDWGHLVFVLPTTVVQLVLLAAPSRAATRRRTLGPAVAAGLLILIVGAAATYVGSGIRSLSIESYWGPRVPLRPVSEIQRLWSIPVVIEYLRKVIQPGDPVFVARAEPLLYFATDARNPTPYPGILPTLREEQQETIVRALENTRFVVMSDIDQPLYTYYSEELPRVQAHLERHYGIARDFPIADFSWIVVLERGQDRGPVGVDLLGERSRASRWIRTLSGRELSTTEPLPKVGVRQNHRPLLVQLGPRGGWVDFELRLPPGARFRAGVGFRGLVSRQNMHVHPSGATMELAVRAQGKSDFETLARHRVDDSRWGGRRWEPFEADLARFGGQRVTLRLATVPDYFFGAETFSWWGSPRITLPPGG